MLTLYISFNLQTRVRIVTILKGHGSRVPQCPHRGCTPSAWTNPISASMVWTYWKHWLKGRRECVLWRDGPTDLRAQVL
jgi:hypothetical protein